MPLVKASAVSGFPEWTPAMRLAELRLIDAIRNQYELYGFTSIETPAVERMSVLTAKGGIRHQVFTVGRPSDDDGEDAVLGLHFDLTVPLARYVVQHAEELAFPFRRYQIQKVWRGERAQRGRFREFTQCDIDIVGRSALDLVHDAEILAVIAAVFDAVEIPGFEIRISNRKILGDLLGSRALPPDLVAEALRCVDRSGRDGLEAVRSAMTELTVPHDLVEATVELLGTGDLAEARRLLRHVGAVTRGVDELELVVDSALQLGLPSERLRIDFSIARGLDYYTGTVYETFIVGNEAWGSVCSGGRYDDLASYFTTRSYPGVGVSIGLTRLVDLLVQAGHLAVGASTPTAALVTTQNRHQFMKDYLGLARTLRAAKIPTEVYLEPAALRDQIAYASSQGIRAAIIAGERELENDVVTVRDLRDHVQETVTGDALADHIKNLLAY
ncbi:histidine--tRNA ligase [Catenulispora yoronensis]|uniref:Histidine--tRNA ligase n=1 Tax=Catenulispora yoronensis TaxID=450799 RepID=A0ABP5G6H8_9ACTN